MESRNWSSSFSAGAHLCKRWLVMAAASLFAFGLPALAQESPPAQRPAPMTESAAPATTSGASAVETVAAGPLIEARKMLWARISQAKNEGIGTGVYITAFKAIEEDVQAGKPIEAIRPRIESLARSLKEQLDRSRMLKTQRPTPPSSSQSIGGEAPSGGKGGGLDGLAAKLGGKDPSALIDKLKEKLNSGDIPEGLKDQIMNSEKGRKLLEKLGQ